MTQDVLGELFGMAQPVANKWIHRLLPILNRTLADLGELPSRAHCTSSASVDASVEIRVQIPFFHDATERPIQRPKDLETLQRKKEATYSEE